MEREALSPSLHLHWPSVRSRGVIGGVIGVSSFFNGGVIGVATTQGNDIVHMMDALGKLRNIFSLVAILSSLKAT